MLLLHTLVSEAALTLLQLPANSDVDGWEKWASALDRVAASLSQVQVAKPRLTVAKYGYCGLPEKPDCVEVTCREIFDLLLYDPLQQVCIPCRDSNDPCGGFLVLNPQLSYCRPQSQISVRS